MRLTADAEIEFALLTTDAGRELLESVTEVTQPSPADIARWRKGASTEAVNAAMRLASARRRGAAKFARAAAMWLDPVGLEQATVEIVADHKAQRFRDVSAVDLCSGIGGDAIALARRARSVVAVDLDQGMCRRILWNASVYEVANRLLAVRAAAERFPIPRSCFVHVDPDRRAHGDRPARAIDQYTPGAAVLKSVARTAAGGAIKLGPASDFREHFGEPSYEVEIVSLNGECKEATVWFGDLATCARRATVLPEGATWTDREAGTPLTTVATTLDAWVFDPDPALSRAGLVDSFAAVLGLARVAPGVDYLTGPRPVASPFLSQFEVIESLPFDRKRLRRAVALGDLGPLDIKVRGLPISPENLRQELRPDGTKPTTLLIYRDRQFARVVVARRIAQRDSSRRCEKLD